MDGDMVQRTVNVILPTGICPVILYSNKEQQITFDSGKKMAYQQNLW